MTTCEWCLQPYARRAKSGGRPQRFCSHDCGDRAWRHTNPRNAWALAIKQFGITPDDYDSMLAAQNGVCAICKRPPKTIRLAVDHDHPTGRVRGLLCAPCNRHLGYFEKWGKSVTTYQETV